ncbi:hypothetical protein FSP39_013277 [Pinctada imbricata]|uniref:Alpha-galactosidase n=1 Tax=Pinctada imbricata TaxID=66713 RepID=A0AA88YIF6_PINIB|nr:hypothetical protein FSP39_013277 [Pinctada imbricata]
MHLDDMPEFWPTQQTVPNERWVFISRSNAYQCNEISQVCLQMHSDNNEMLKVLILYRKEELSPKNLQNRPETVPTPVGDCDMIRLGKGNLMKMKALLVFVVLLVTVCRGLDNGLARTPPMGFNSWERFRCVTDCDQFPDTCISEKLYKRIADLMVSEGFVDAGYEYVNIDDCWMAKTRDENDRLIGDPERFPSGIKALADYMHSKGLKLGIYEDFGTETCGGFPGSEFYLKTDAQTFADWGIDLLKLDGCYSFTHDMPVGYPTMEHFLNETGRPMLYSCSWPAYFYPKIPDYDKISTSCNIWRNYADVQDSWDSVLGIMNFYGKNSGNFSAKGGPGHFNDPDMIIVGNYGLSYDQQRVQMAIWAIIAAPLFFSTDLATIKPESKALLLNKNVIAVSQDSLGIEGELAFSLNDVQIWIRRVKPEGSIAFAIVYTGTGGTPKLIQIQCASLGMIKKGVPYSVMEVFDGKHMGLYKATDMFNATVNPTGVFFGRATILG